MIQLFIPKSTCFERPPAVYGHFLLKFWMVAQSKFDCAVSLCFKRQYSSVNGGILPVGPCCPGGPEQW